MQKLITITGPTATGKTTLAAHIADKIDGQIISADSRQIYTGMDIGTGKDLDEYQIDGHRIPYHLIDIRPAGYKYNLYEYQQDFLAAYQQIIAQHHTPILCGGTGLYIEAVLKGYRLLEVPVNPALRQQLQSLPLDRLTQILDQYPQYHRHNNTDTDTTRRAIRAIEIADYYARNPQTDTEYPRFQPIIIMIDISRETRRDRITRRLKTRLQDGMVDEVRTLLDSGLQPDDLIYYGLEYRHITEYIIGRTDYDTMFVNLETAIHQFAKRQMTWFRGMERRGYTIHKIDGEQDLDHRIRQTAQILRQYDIEIPTP